MCNIWGRIGLLLPLAALVFAPALPAKTIPAKTVIAPYYGHRSSGNYRSPAWLTGTVRGTFTFQRAVPDVGQGYTLMGSGRVNPLGSVQASGSFQSLGFIASGNARGHITLRNVRGSITLALVGPKQRGFGRLPSDFQYATVSGSGVYRLTRKHGSVHLILRQEMRQDANGEFVMTFVR